MKPKTKASIALLVLATILAIIITLFFVGSASPLVKWIDVGLSCSETGEHVPDGLAIKLFGMGYEVTEYTTDGRVQFGSGLVDGTYDISWFWCVERVETVTIDCSKLTWTFDFEVPNPTIIKHFVYDTPYNDYPPVVGLNVSLLNNGTPEVIAWQLTDATGTVTFGGDLVAVCKEYSLAWTWGGVEASEGPIHFVYDDLCRLCENVWEQTNYLPAKSGGG